MPRGNDAEAAAEELKAKLGASPNAQEMIDLSAARWPQELRAANNRPLNEAATDEMDDEKAQGFVGDREVLGYAVRGPFLVVVSADDSGFTVKQAFALDEKKAERAARPAPVYEPEATPEPETEPEAEAEEEKPKAAAARK